ncbi:MAG: hypothetical protein K2M72_09875 [Paramuribaculum sp.]|nr:hypothetical protein [Paramuribaculum sp.]
MKFKRIILHVISVCFLAIACRAASPRNLMDGRLYLSSDSVITSNDTVGIEVPVKRKPLRIVANPYTARQKVIRKIAPDQVDSLTLWNRTASDRHHTFRYLSRYGWCWLLNRGEVISVYAYSPKGYIIAGNGGMWARKKLDVIVKKGDNTYVFSKTGKHADKKFKKQVAAIVADDAELVSRIMQSSSRRDKILRMLSLYSPDK